MLSISLLLAAGTAATGPIAGKACPASHLGKQLSYSQVSNGPPEERVILREDSGRTVRGVTTSSWDVSYIYEEGRQVHLFCEYAKGSSLVVRVAQPVTTCRYTAQRRRETLSCR